MLQHHEGKRSNAKEQDGGQRSAHFSGKDDCRYQCRNEVIMSAAVRPGIPEGIDEEKPGDQQHKRPVKIFIRVAESGQIIEEQKEDARPQIENQQQQVVLLSQDSEGATDVSSRTQQSYGIEQTMFQREAPGVPEESGCN